MASPDQATIEANMRAALQALSTTAKTPQQKLSFEKECEGFERLFSRFLESKVKKTEFVWEEISPAPAHILKQYQDLPQPCKDLVSLLNKVVVVKLNGGLGTTMGCTGPKSVIEAHSGKSFLDLTVIQTQAVNQKYGVDIPLVLMNSFSTHSDTMKVINKYINAPNIHIDTFMQSQYPRFDMDKLLPLAKTLDGPESDWYPPGHGDFYRSFYNSGLLEKFLAQGKKYVFVSNIDNLGATVDPVIANYVEDSKANFLMELTDKTRADVKGGTLIEYRGGARLLEIAQVPAPKIPEFASLKKFKIFNTNNLWVNMAAIVPAIKSGAVDNLDIIVNKKPYTGGTLIQLETAMCAAVQSFPGACGINVPRSRFLPVKAVNDLLVIQSNLYSLDKGGNLVPHPDRLFPHIPPTVKLGDYFKKVGDYQKRFPGIPNLLELEHLTIAGDVSFGPGVVLKGTVIIVAPPGCHIDIPAGAVFENKVITGNLTITEH